MCGIAGVVAQRQDAGLTDSVKAMVEALAHRGPDSSGVQNLGACLLGNTRLAINDLSENGRQPMCNEDSTVWITYNGESYNAPYLRCLLSGYGHRFHSTSDTEVVLHLYEQFGDDCVSKLQGMFAFAIWDAQRAKLLLARDRLGIKPLYYSVRTSGLIFASEVKALLSSGLVQRKLDPAGVQLFLQLGHIPPPRTAIQNVRPLGPGCIAIWKDGQIREESYWRLPLHSNGHRPDDLDEAPRKFRELLSETSRSHLMSDVPIALFLSGGVDSAVLGSLVRSAGASQVTALTIGFEESEFDESEASRRTAKVLGMEHRLIRLSAAPITESLDRALWAMDQPTVDGINAYWISRVAAEEGFKVALSGQGGDELFGGYESTAWFRRFSHLAQMLEWVPEKFGEWTFGRPSLAFRLRKLSYLFGADDPFVAAQLAVRVIFPEKDAAELLNQNLSSRAHELDAEGLIRDLALLTRGQELRARIAFMDFPLHLQARLLRDGDAFSMAHGLEVRPVFLDHRIVESVLSLPASLRLRRKRFLLDSVRELMPATLASDLATRPKRTFTFPFSSWLGGHMKDTVEAALRPEQIAAGGVLNPLAVEQLWTRYLDNPRSVGWSRVWSLFVLARWCQIMKVEA